MAVLHRRLTLALGMAALLLPRGASAADQEWSAAVGRGLDGAFGRAGIESVPLAPATLLAWLEVAQPQVHPQPPHTGFGTLFKDVAHDFGRFPRRRSTWVILGVGLGAAAIAHPADDDIQEHITGSKTADRAFVVGKYLGATYTQVGLALGTYLVGRYVVPKEGESRTNRVSHLGLDLLRAQIETGVFVLAVKQAVRRDRPTGECCAFPSGHAAATFAAASVLERHLGYRFAWPTVVAGFYVAASRLQDNRHFLSDVVFGAAVGTAVGWTVVGRHGHSSYAFAPVPVRGGVMLSLQRRYSRSPDDRRTWRPSSVMSHPTPRLRNSAS